MIKRVLQILFLLINVTCFSQVSEQYFSDSCYIGAMNGLAVKHRSFVFAGATVYDNGQRLVLCKINANGDTVWSTSQPSYYEERFISLTTSQEGDIYALIGIPENFGKYNKYFIWKVEGNTGKVKWIYSHESNEYSVCIKDFDTVKVILLQTLTSKIKLIPISKKTGIADSAFYINKAISLKMIAFDSAKYMYFHKSVDTLIKVSYNKPDSIIWQKKFQRTSSEDYFNSIIIDSMGRFFLISSKSGYSQIAKINQWTGDTIFTRKLPDKYLWYVDAGNDMYLTFDNIDHVKNVVRVNKNSGVTKIISLPDNQSLDADSLGNIYYVCLYGPYGSIPYYCIYRWNEPGGTTEYITRIYNYKGLPNMSPNY